MPKLRNILGGMAGAMVLCSVPVVAQAQDAGASSGCSGILCVFSSAPSTQAAPPAQPIAAAPAAVPAAAADAVVASKPKPKAVRPAVTIAADAAEIGRLKDLAAAMPKERVRIVKSPTDSAAADFAVSTTLETRPGVEKAKLFTEQMHVLAGAKIGALADLAGKVVSFGPDKSASQAAGRKAFAALGVTVKETPLELDNALDGLATGDIDAVVVLAPQPDARLAKLAGQGLHLVAWPRDATLPDGAVAVSIDGARYPHIAKAGEAIPALGADAVLVLGPKGEAKEGREPAAKSAATKSFLTALSQHSAALAKRGFDLLRADLDARADRHVAEAGAR